MQDLNTNFCSKLAQHDILSDVTRDLKTLSVMNTNAERLIQGDISTESQITNETQNQLNHVNRSNIRNDPRSTRRPGNDVDDATTVSCSSQIPTEKARRNVSNEQSNDFFASLLPSLPDDCVSNGSMNTLFDPFDVTLQNSNHNHNHNCNCQDRDVIFPLPTTPIINMDPPIIGSVIEIRRRSDSSRESSLCSKPKSLVSNRVMLSPLKSTDSNHANSDQKEDEEKDHILKDDDNQSKGTESTFASNQSKRENDGQASTDCNSENESRFLSETFKVPPLMRLTRKNCNMDMFPKILMDEHVMDQFMISQSPIQRRAQGLYSLKSSTTSRKRKRTAKRRTTTSSTRRKKKPPKVIRSCHSRRRISTEISPVIAVQTPPSKRHRGNMHKLHNPVTSDSDSTDSNSSDSDLGIKRHTSISSKSSIRNHRMNLVSSELAESGCLTIPQITPLFPRTPRNGRPESIDSIHSLQSVHSLESIEFPRGLIGDDLEYEHRLPAFQPFPGNTSSVNDELENRSNLINGVSAVTAPSTPRTSASAPLITPSTDYSGMLLDSERVQRSAMVLSGVMEESQGRNIDLNMDSMDLNEMTPCGFREEIDTISPLQLTFEECVDRVESTLSVSPPPPVELQRMDKRERRREWRRGRNGVGIKRLNECTRSILREKLEDYDEQRGETHCGVSFGELLRRQDEVSGGLTSQVTVAMRFLSLLIISTDSRGNRDIGEIDLERHCDDTGTADVMGDFVISLKE